MKSSPILASAALAQFTAAQITPSNLTPNGKKAGLSGYVGIQNTPAFANLSSHISWYSDYDPDTPDANGVMGIGMLWGADGSSCGSVESDRLATFKSMIANGTIPQIMFGFYEPDCSCPYSSGMSISDAANDWNSLLAPLAAAASSSSNSSNSTGAATVLGSPSMCTQKDETFLTPFNASLTRTWDVTSIHINKPDLAGAQADVEHYVATYGKPVWVSEFACVHDQPSFQPCTDQDEINAFINDVVPYFQNNPDIVAYGPSNGAGLGDTWPLTDSSTGELTATGETYLNAIMNF